MRTKGNTVLITGGASGIGLALAQAFLHQDNQVIICGRSPEKLEAVRKNLPEVNVVHCDVANPDQRDQLFEWIRTYHPQLNVLVNNAATLNFINLAHQSFSVKAIEQEVQTNLVAPIAMSQLFLTHVSQRVPGAIVNIGAAVAYTPVTQFPVYSATKAALHSFSQSLRYQLRESPIAVFEVMPPAVDTAMTKEINLKKMQPSELAKEILKGLARGKTEIRVGVDTQLMYLLSRLVPKLTLNIVNRVMGQ